MTISYRDKFGFENIKAHIESTSIEYDRGMFATTLEEMNQMINSGGITAVGKCNLNFDTGRLHKSAIGIVAAETFIKRVGDFAEEEIITIDMVREMFIAKEFLACSMVGYDYSSLIVRIDFILHRCLRALIDSK